MKIIERGNHPNNEILQGKCKKCGCVVECTRKETQTLIDRDTVPGMATQYVRCPTCDHNYLWVK